MSGGRDMGWLTMLTPDSSPPSLHGSHGGDFSPERVNKRQSMGERLHLGGAGDRQDDSN